MLYVCEPQNQVLRRPIVRITIMVIEKKVKKTRSMKQEQSVYCGELFYTEDEERIVVFRFIVRKDEISFHLDTEADLGGHWAFSGIAKQVPGHEKLYVCPHIKGNEVVGHTKGDEGRFVRFEFEIEKQSEQRLQIGGRWISGGAIHGFSGTLKKYAPHNR